MQRLAILGASGHGKVVADAAELAGWKEVVFYDDAWPEKSLNQHWIIAGTSHDLITNSPDFDGIVVAIGNNVIRHLKAKSLTDNGANLVSIVHPNACISRYALIGIGSVIFANAVVNAGAVIGDNTILNTSSTIDHDCILGSAVHISPGANLSGGVKIGNRSWLGIGSSVKQGIEIGSDVIIGAGGVVVKNVPDNTVFVGNPARIHEHNK